MYQQQQPPQRQLYGGYGQQQRQHGNISYNNGYKQNNNSNSNGMYNNDHNKKTNHHNDNNHNNNNNNLRMIMNETKKYKSKLLLNLDKYKNQDEDDEINNDDTMKKQINLAEERVDLVDCKKELHFNQRDMEKQIERDRDLMQKLSAEIRPASRRNFELEKNLSVLDKQIQLLIQNMISLAELNDMAGGVFTQMPNAANQLKSPLLGMLCCMHSLSH